MKGQLEFAAIAGLVAIVIIALFFLLSPRPQTRNDQIPWLADEQKTIRDSVNNFMKIAVRNAIVDIYNQGGFANMQTAKTIDAAGSKIAVWSECNTLSIPDIESEIAASINSYIVGNLESQMFYGRNVTFHFEELHTEVSILDESVRAKITLPADVSRYDILRQYDISVPSNLKKIMEFSKEFTQEENETKFFGLASLITMDSMNPYSDEYVPIVDTRIGCYQPPIFKTGKELEDGISTAINYTITHIVWKKGGLRLASNPFYPIDVIKGKSYDLDVVFNYPEWNLHDYFVSNPSTFKSVVKPVSTNIAGMQLPVAPFCFDRYGVSYSYKFPVIISVKDEMMNQWFQFAIMADVTGNVPGGCTADVSEERTEYQKLCIDDAGCSLQLNVMDTAGHTLEDADAYFDRCYLGKTDSWGRISANIPCRIGELSVYKDGFMSHGEMVATKRSNTVDVFMKKRKNEVEIFFMGVPMIASGRLERDTYLSYDVMFQPVLIDRFLRSSSPYLHASATLTPIKPNMLTGEQIALIAENIDEDGEITSSSTISMLNPIKYNVTGFVKREYDGKMIGYINDSIEIPENIDHLCLYYPVVIIQESNPWLIDDSISYAESTKMMDALKDAGINPVQINCDLSSLAATPPTGPFCGDGIVETPNGDGVDEECDSGHDSACCVNCEWACNDGNYDEFDLEFIDGAEHIFESGDAATLKFPACRIFDENSAVAEIEKIPITTQTAIVFVTDTSDSMLYDIYGNEVSECNDNNDLEEHIWPIDDAECKLNLALNALIESINKMYSADEYHVLHIGIVDFGGSVSAQPIGLLSEEHKNDLIDVISHYSTSYGTHTKDAIEAAKDMLLDYKDSHPAIKKLVMVLLTDGAPYPPDTQDPNPASGTSVTDETKDAGIDIYTIAYADDDNLKEAVCAWSSAPSCPDTDGEFSFAGDNAAAAYDAIVGRVMKIPTGELKVTADGKMTTASITNEHEIPLDLSSVECSSSEQYIPITVEFEGGGKIGLTNIRMNYCPIC
ncbi:MAG: VWA domain-containing protein [Candidatus Micrarchaeota archaeon]|nr:VWA domain-containing protein [Candidatus Micrarchaeota archaeon]